jgi:hypothetical protein
MQAHFVRPRILVKPCGAINILPLARLFEPHTWMLLM